jgi:hypothetical protein
MGQLWWALAIFCGTLSCFIPWFSALLQPPSLSNCNTRSKWAGNSLLAFPLLFQQIPTAHITSIGITHFLVHPNGMLLSMVTKSSDPSTEEGKEALFKDEWFLSPDDKIRFLSNTQLDYTSRDNLLSALAKVEVKDLKNGVKAISIASSLKEPFDSVLCPNVLFERSFYGDLLTEMRRPKAGCALIGSSGTSKSTFQYWFLFKVIEAFEKGKILIFKLDDLYAKYYLFSICHAGLPLTFISESIILRW